MDVKFVSEARADALVVMAADGQLGATGQALDAKIGGALAKAMAASRFTGAAGQVLEVLSPQGIEASRVLAIGVGGWDKADALGIERWAGHAVRRLLVSGAERVALQLDSLKNVTAAEAAARAAIGSRLAAYRFDKRKTKQKPEQLPSLVEVQVVTDGPAAAASRYENEAFVVDGVLWARDLVAEPANVLYPDEFARRIKELEALSVEVEVLGPADLEKLGMHALLGVGQGSARPPCVVVMHWRGLKNKGAQPVALVGKGVTFDTGGISIKPAAGMEDMRGDMGGAAAVVGAMKALAARKAKANVVGVVGLVENMPDGAAQRPGDVVISASGQTIEVLNTDAEGRLVLADAIWYAQEKLNCMTVIDLATLTGAAITALGHEYAALLSNDDDLAHAVAAAAAAEGEPVWRLPLGPAYDKLLDTPNADMKNIAGKPVAGTIVGAQFVQRFIRAGTPWAHLDIAGTAWKGGPYEDPTQPAWATGYGVRLLNRLIAQRFEE